MTATSGPFPASADGHDDIEYIDIQTTPLAVVRADGLTMDGIRDAFDAGFGALGQAIGSGQVTPTGPALAIYHGDPAASFDLEIAFPVAEPVAGPSAVGEATIDGGTLPGGRFAALTMRGGYDGMGAAWERLVSGAAADGHQPTGVWIEVYVADPSTAAEDDLRTDLYYPVDR